MSTTVPDCLTPSQTMIIMWLATFHVRINLLPWPFQKPIQYSVNKYSPEQLHNGSAQSHLFWSFLQFVTASNSLCTQWQYYKNQWLIEEHENLYFTTLLWSPILLNMTLSFSMYDSKGVFDWCDTQEGVQIPWDWTSSTEHKKWWRPLDKQSHLGVVW